VAYVKRNITDPGKHPCSQSLVIAVMGDNATPLESDVLAHVTSEQLLPLFFKGSPFAQ